jgi:NAD(P)-dependent dehydrogenase (short-subunit alcohol dehydrogenase family)
MVSPFGIISTRTPQRDALGREHERLVLAGVGLLAGAGPISYDTADLDHLARAELDPLPSDALAYWPDDLARSLAPLAVVHAAAPGATVASLHGAALCVLANLADGRAACESAFEGDVAWLEGAPGPSLARAVAGVRQPAALVPGLGFVLWSDTAVGLLSRAGGFEHRARDWLAGKRLRVADEGEARGTEAKIDDAHENDLVKLRGQLCRDHRGVLLVDPSMEAFARRIDAGRLVELAAGLEPLGPLAAHVGVDARLEPGLGLVTAGADEPDARDRSLLAGHALRVAVALVEGDAAPRAVPAPDQRLELPAAEPDPSAVLRGRVVIVTGAASGIGRDVARHLASIGAQLALADVSREGLEALAEELDGPQGQPLTIAGDLTDEGVIDGLVAATVARFGGIDGAVLNVGVALPGELQALTTADWRRSLDVNTTSHFLLVRRLLPLLEAQGLGGSLVFIGSKNMFSPGAGFGAYSASKAALAQLARLVAIEAGPYGVRSNIVNPDNVFGGSALWSPELRAQRAAVYKIDPEDLEAYYTQRNLMKVPISGMDVARAVAFLLSDDAAKTTACVLTVDGGVPGVFPR